MPKQEITVRRFKSPDMQSHFWVEYRHYFLTAEKEIRLIAGGTESEEHKEVLIKYLKRNKLL